MLNLVLNEIARKDNLYIEHTASLNSLIELMNRNQRGVVVVLRDNRPLGILTERDIVGIVYEGTDLDDRVDKYAKKTLVTTRGDRTIGYALNLTLVNNIRRVVVVDDSDNFLGIVTLQDLLKYIEEDFYRLTIKVKHILKRIGYLISVLPEDPISKAVEIIAKNKISAVPVIEDGKAIGILTEKDILRLLSEKISLDNRISKYMSSPVETTNLDTPLAEVVERMNCKKIRQVVVVDGKGMAADMITIRDVVENIEGDYNRFLEKKLQSAKEILNLLPEMLIEITDTGSGQLIIWANDKVINTFGGDILDNPITKLLPAEQWNNIYRILTRLNKIEHYKIKKDDRIYELSGFFIKTFFGSERGRFHIIMRDITEDIILSTIDPLTNIYNRRFINGFLIKEIEKSKRLNRHFSLVITDIDDFKFINDTYGHMSGDIVLESISRLITSTSRSYDIVGRYGGDEFMIILPDASNAAASNVIDRMRQKVADTLFTVIKDMKVNITASFGISTFPEDGKSIDDLLIKADERLYKSKGLGKNKVSCN